MKKRARDLGGLAMALLLGVALTGCGDNLLGPQSPGSSYTSGATEVPVLAVAADGAVSYDSVSTGSLLWEAFPVIDAILDGSPALTVSAKVDGAVGGVLRASRFVLTVPPGAFNGVANITMTLPDSTVMLCDMDISPAGLSPFKVPLALTLNTRDLGVDPSTLSIYWYDPATVRWVDMHSVADMGTGTVTERLWHFSRYAGGKAGW